MSTRRWQRGALSVVGGILVAAALAGCQATPGKYTYVDARSASHSAAKIALAGLPATRKVLSDAHITCPSDTGFFASSFTWRTVTSVAAPKDQVQQANARVLATMAARGWRASTPRNGITTLTPRTKAATPARVARMLTDVEPNAVVLTVFSSCYGG
ncbi:MAG TPA: hypothetical protein VGM94_04200 [Galbitalea sp.]|jgi:hypothetical protein